MTKPLEHPLELVFASCLHQVTQGKGNRHGGHLYQAEKKLVEAKDRLNTGDITLEKYQEELLGAMAYIGMEILYRCRYPTPG